MDPRMNFALKRKRELLSTMNKRKMSLRKFIYNLKQNECQLEITQVTKCVFLGSLFLKPNPHLFDSPDLVLELDMKLGNEENQKEVNDENVNQTQPTNDKTESVKKKRQKGLEVPRTRRRLCRDKLDIIHTKKVNPDSMQEEIYDSSNTNKCENETIAQTICNPQPPNKEENLLQTSESLALTSERQNLTPEDDLEGVEFIEMSLIDPKHELLNGSLCSEEINQRASPFEEVLIKGKSCQLENNDECDKSLDGIPIEKNGSDNPKEEYILSNYGGEELFDLGGKSPELVLPDSDEDTLDQLMMSIMDIKVEPNVYYDIPPSSEIEDLQPEYQSSPEDKPSPKIQKKYFKRTIQCKICSKEFSSYMKLKKHKKEHDGENPYPCIKCGENHCTLDQLIAHLRTHEGKHPYVCKKCNAGFETPKELEDHKPVHILRKTVSPKRSFRCDVCYKEFKKLCDLDRHSRVHTGEKPSVCNICNRRFQQAHNLNKHLLIHTQEKPFECDICNKRFGRNDVLTRHLLTHSVKKPNLCDICMKSFIRVSQLQAHKEKYHLQQVS